MCETTIEKAGTEKKAYKTDWNVETKIASITYDSKKTNSDAVLKNIALSGYDNEKYLAPDEAYNKLPNCCKYTREKKISTAIIKANHSEHPPQNTTTATQEANQLQIIFDNYFAIKDALVKTDGETASAKAGALLSALNAVKMENLKAEERAVWMNVEKDLKFDTEHITDTKDAEHQRSHFATLSKNMYALIKASKPSEKIYYQNCPMYNDGKGANWLSKESAIKNPYYGNKMLTCGKTIETIK